VLTLIAVEAPLKSNSGGELQTYSYTTYSEANAEAENRKRRKRWSLMGIS